MRNRLKYLVIPGVILVFSGFFISDNDVYFRISKSIDIFGRVYKEVSFNYVEEINPEEFMLSGINGMLASLDPYTIYIDEKRKEDIDLLTNGKYGGIGVSIGIRNDKITIVDLIEGYSAQRQGVRIGDIVTRVNDVEINVNNFDDVSSLVKGEPGTDVSITVYREETNEFIVYNMVREEIQIKNLTFYGFYPENSNNVYLKLSSFTRTAGDEIKKAIVELRNKNIIKSIVLDLRGNPGGLLDAAVDVCEKFIPKNQLIVTVMGRDSSSRKRYLSTEEPIAGEAKLIVLVDNGSASASEIVAGAIQDHDRGVVLGNETFGKGLVQTVIPLSYNNSLKITTAKYYTPSGRCIQKVDYSKNNKVYQNSHENISSKFKTDNNREVYSSGGIKPDTVVNNTSSSNVVVDLLARGLFFKFATKYFNLNVQKNFVEIKDEVLLGEFLDYLKKEKAEYKSLAEKQLEELAKTAETEKYSKDILNDLGKLKSSFSLMRDTEVKNNKTFVLHEIRSELAARYFGNSGRIRESLSHDTQLKIAMDITNKENLYSSLLAISRQ